MFDLPFPPARNPWHTNHHPGGSSFDAGAGVAGGLFPLAVGTDTGGSIRRPASACGIYGLKPTYGLVSRRGVFPLAFTLDHLGPLARSVADTATLLDAIASQDPANPGRAACKRLTFSDDLNRGVSGLRIVYVRHFHETDSPADPEVAAALDAVAATLANAGTVLRDIMLPPLGAFAAVNRVILKSEAWSVHAPWLRSRPVDSTQATHRRLMAGAFLDV